MHTDQSLCTLLSLKNLITSYLLCKGVIRDLIGGNVGGLLDPLGIFKPKGNADASSHASSNAQSLGGGFNIGPIGVGGGFSSASASSSASAHGGGAASASAKADAQANGYGGYGGANSNAQASADANAQGRFRYT